MDGMVFHGKLLLMFCRCILMNVHTLQYVENTVSVLKDNAVALVEILMMTFSISWMTGNLTLAAP